MAEVKPFVGIDVSKAQLDDALGANEGTFSRGAFQNRIENRASLRVIYIPPELFGELNSCWRIVI